MAVLVDNLSPVSRAFYERTRFKFFLSVIYGAAALTLIGFSSEAGGVSYCLTKLAQVSTSIIPQAVTNIYFPVFYFPVDFILLSSDENIVTSNSNRMSGYAFACFSHFVAFLLAVSAAIIISPVFSGSPNEKTTLRNPMEIVDIMSTEGTGNEQTVKDWIEQERVESVSSISRISVADSNNNTPLKANEY